MIVRDEEDWLEQCLRSVEGLVDETIIVDTGSVDSTRTIARAHGAELIEETWRNDFAFVRNLSLSRASGKWILVLDADEALDSHSHQIIRGLIQGSPAAYELTQRHYSNDVRLSDFRPVRGQFPAWERRYAGFFESKLVRLFPNIPQIQYRGQVHELVEGSIRESGCVPIVNSGILLHHYGNTPEVVAKKRKNSVYTSLCLEKATELPNDFKALFDLGVAANVAGDSRLSRDALNKSTILNPNYVPTWINLGYVLCELAEYGEAHKALEQALIRDPQAAEAYCNRGVVYLRQKDFQKAALSFLKAIENKRDYINAYTNLANAFLCLGDKSRAIETLECALEQQPNSVQLKELLGAIYLEIGKPTLAEHYLRSAQTT